MRTDLQKLVRDRIPELLAEAGIAHESSVLADEAFRVALFKKLLEEAGEVVSASADERLEELADAQEVLDTIASLSGFTCEHVRAVQEQKREARGGFHKRILLRWFEEPK